MKKLLFLLLTVAAFSSAQAQDPVTKYRTEDSLDTNAIYVVHSTSRTFPGGEVVVEEVWRPVVKDSLKSYIARLEKVEEQAVLNIEKAKTSRAEARDEIKRLKRELEGRGEHRTVLKAPQVLDIPSAGTGLAPGEYIFDGQTFTPKPAKKKVATKKKKS